MEIIAGRFRVDKWLGEGHLGQLYLVEQQERPVRNTLRVLPRAAAGSPPPNALVTHDATRIRHPNIAQVHEVGQTPDGLIYVAMDNAVGTLLAEVEARGAVPLRWAIEIARQMVAAIRAAHETGTIHGALTPESVVIASTEDDTLTVRILDLGLSTLFHMQGCPPDPRYASPEILAGAAPDERSDVFSLGAVIYHIMTGTPVGIPEPNQIPEALGSVLATALARKPEDRFQTVAQFGEALGHAWAEPATPSATVQAAPAAMREAASTRVRRKVGFVGLAVAAAALMLVWLYRPATRPVGNAAPGRPLPVAPEDHAGTQWAKVPTAAPTETSPSEKPAPAPAKGATVAVSKAARRTSTLPTALPGQGYEAGLARDETPPADVVAPAAPADAETSTEAVIPSDAATPANPSPEVETEPLAAAPAAAPTAASKAGAAMAEARAAAATAVNSYASAIEAHDVDAIRRVYPGLTDQERSAWQEFFSAARDLKAQLTIKDVNVKDGVTEAQVTGVYEYANRSLNRVERKPVSFRATLTRGPGGWRLSEVR